MLLEHLPPTPVITPTPPTPPEMNPAPCFDVSAAPHTKIPCSALPNTYDGDRAVLKASVHDVRYFAALLRAVNLANRATFTVTSRGLTITVEEARTLLGTAFVFSDIFDEYSYHSDVVQSSQESDDAEINVGFEIPLSTLIECLNIFGTAGAPPANAGTKYKKWKKTGNDSDHDDDDDRGGRGRTGARGLDTYFSGSDKKTGMRLTYAGPGDPLTLLLAEDATGPTTRCEIATFEFEPHLELPFDASCTVLKVILKSSWLRDALSELDPSFDKLTFIGSPPPEAEDSTPRERRKPRTVEKPMLRIQAAGTFGSTEIWAYNKDTSGIAKFNQNFVAD
ncbi:hypothetical protein C0995_016373 [Termitomyces sp. Mi166|nr:hypothetical protein C0995_016373 [Termitomyces sp. Mi166\